MKTALEEAWDLWVKTYGCTLGTKADRRRYGVIYLEELTKIEKQILNARMEWWVENNDIFC